MEDGAHAQLAAARGFSNGRDNVIFRTAGTPLIVLETILIYKHAPL